MPVPTKAVIKKAHTNENDILKDLGKVAGMLRISTEKTDNAGKKVNLEKTLRNHKQKMLEFFDEHNMNDKYDLFEEVVSGGADRENRPEFDKLIKNLDHYTAIFCIEITRLSRQGDTGQLLKRECQKRGIMIITLNPFKIYNMANPQDVVMFDMSITMGEYERSLTSLRVKQNKIAMAKQGLNASGSVPFGYYRNPATKRLEIEQIQKMEDGKLVFDDQMKPVMIESPKAAIVRMIFQWYLEGEGQRTICDRLNSMGIKNKNGNTWIPNSLRVLLECRTYKGTLMATHYGIDKGKTVALEQVEIENNHPAIIDPETFDKAQQLRNNKRDRSGVDQRSKDWNSKKNMSILDGLVFCKCCTRKSTIKWYPSKNNFYIIKCTKFNASGLTCDNGGVNIKDVEKLVFEKILSYKEEIENKISKFQSNDFTDSIQELKDQKELFEKQLETLKIKMKIIRKNEQNYELQKEVENIIDLDEEEAIAEDKKENQQQRLKVQAKLDAIKEQMEAAPAPEQQIKTLVEKRNIIEELQKKDLTVKQVNMLLKQIILKIDYKRELPANYKTLGRSEKEGFEAEIEIEYIN